MNEWRDNESLNTRNFRLVVLESTIDSDESIRKLSHFCYSCFPISQIQPSEVKHVFYEDDTSELYSLEAENLVSGCSNFTTEQGSCPLR